MATSQQRSAIIYDFVAAARARAAADARPPRSETPAARRFPTVDCGSSWYHAAAIDEERSRKP